MTNGEATPFNGSREKTPDENKTHHIVESPNEDKVALPPSTIDKI